MYTIHFLLPPYALGTAISQAMDEKVKDQTDVIWHIYVYLILESGMPSTAPSKTSSSWALWRRFRLRSWEWEWHLRGSGRTRSA